MNAGCYGKEFKDVLIQAKGFQRDGTPFSLTPAELEMRYRKTSLPEGWIFTAASFRVEDSPGEAIRSRMKEMIAARADSQPVGVRTGGSTFANPDGTKAWQVIDAAGCRGLQRGDASISEKHCNFLINKGGASADDLEQLGEMCAMRLRRVAEFVCAGKFNALDARETQMPAFDRKVAVLMGGWTSEAAVSRVSASFCSKAARLAGWDAIEVELDQRYYCQA